MVEALTNEQLRILSLQRYRILDTSPDKQFDRITTLASELLDAPIALVSLVDEHRQWFKSKVGLDASETPREHAFCAHAILDDSVLQITDAALDPRFANNPLVTSYPNIRFYAGAPLITDDGHRLGTLCVIDQKPRTLNKQQLDTLRGLSQLVVDALELHLNRLEHSEMRTELRHHRQDLAQFERLTSHDLHGPLRQMRTATAMVRDDIEGMGLTPSPELLEDLEILEQASDQMRALADALVSLSELSHRPLRTHTVPLSAALRDLTASMPDTGAQFTIGALPSVTADETLLLRCYRQLIENACQFQPDDQPLSISFTAEPAEGGWILGVQDNGRGISPHLAERAFYPFVTFQPGTSGVGIGLTVCAKIIQRHGGRSWIEPAAPTGTHVRFFLPSTLTEPAPPAG